MKLFLFSTVDMKSDRLTAFERMVQSVSGAERALGPDSVRLFVLFQRCSPDDLETWRSRLPGFITCAAVDQLRPLSVARNLLLRPVIDSGVLMDDTWVAFPDDDAWYPAGFLQNRHADFQSCNELDFWFCAYGSDPLKEGTSRASTSRPKFADVVRRCSSNTMLFRGSLISRIGLFDERLGLGAPLGSGEDIDYALRAWALSRDMEYTPLKLVGHRDKSGAMKARYYEGSLVVLARHVWRGGVAEFLRKLAIGIYFVAKGELSAASYGQTLGEAMANLGQDAATG